MLNRLNNIVSARVLLWFRHFRASVDSVGLVIQLNS